MERKIVKYIYPKRVKIRRKSGVRSKYIPFAGRKKNCFQGRIWVPTKIKTLAMTLYFSGADMGSYENKDPCNDLVLFRGGYRFLLNIGPCNDLVLFRGGYGFLLKYRSLQ
jgi:hypothetical protein